MKCGAVVVFVVLVWWRVDVCGGVWVVECGGGSGAWRWWLLVVVVVVCRVSRRNIGVNSDCFVARAWLGVLLPKEKFMLLDCLFWGPLSFKGRLRGLGET